MEKRELIKGLIGIEARKLDNEDQWGLLSELYEEHTAARARIDELIADDERRGWAYEYRLAVLPVYRAR